VESVAGTAEKEGVAVPSSKNPPTPDDLDDIDRALLAALVADGRMTNAALAARVGIAESTCLARVRALRRSGVITGIHAQVDPAALGLPIQAVIKVRLSSHSPHQVLRFHDRLATIPGVLTAFHVAGGDDYLLHVAVANPEALRSFILENLTVQPGVSQTETQLVVEVMTGAGVLP
jgi:DNA-binding Lrp family transcriptional regulator